MRHFTHKRTAVFTLALALCLSLFGCASGPKQDAAENSEEAVVHFLTDLQQGNYDMAKTYMKEGNELLHVLPTEEGQVIPEMEDVYQQFCNKLGSLTFQVTEGEADGGGSIVYITAQQYDFDSAIRAAMLDALQKQCREGGSAFASYADWMSQGIANAEMGAEETEHIIASKTSGKYILQHEGYGDVAFLNMVTGGFYEYADFQMAVCTGTEDGVEYNYYVAALGDRVVAYLEDVSEVYTAEEMSDEQLAEVSDYYAQISDLVEGIDVGVYRDGDRVHICTGIDFETADQNSLIDAGIVDGKFRGNTTSSHLSLAATISNFEGDGLTCTVTPVYEAKDEK